MEALHGDGDDCLSCSASPSKLARVEVFSAQLIGINPYNHKDYYGLILLESCDLGAIFESSPLKSPLISPKGCITLTGPENGIPVEHEIVIYPLILNVGVSHMNKDASILWSASSDGFNKYICKRIELLSKFLQVHFAVYNDAVEARLEVLLVDMKHGDAADESILIHGTVTCRNNYVSDVGAGSVLFQKDSGDEVRIRSCRSVALPLSRRMVVVPRGSDLHVDVCLGIGSENENASSVEGVLVFNGNSELEEDCIPIPHGGKVSVKVTWMYSKYHV